MTNSSLSTQWPTIEKRQVPDAGVLSSVVRFTARPPTLEEDEVNDGETNLLPGESIEWRSRAHWYQLLWPSTLSIFLGLIAFFLFLGAAMPNGSLGGTLVLTAAGLLFLFVGVAIEVFVVMFWLSTQLLLTQKRLLAVAGGWKKRIVSIHLTAIEMAGFQQESLGEKLDFGDIVVFQWGGFAHCFKKITKPIEFLNHLCELRAQLSESDDNNA